MDSENLCATGYTIYLSVHEAILELGKSNPALAFEYYKALANYNFYNEEYQGDNVMIRLMAKQQYPLIDNQRARYNKSIKGGQSKREQIPWEKIEAAAKTGQFHTLQSLGVYFGTSGQNIGKRMKNKGTSLPELIQKGIDEVLETKSENENNFETNGQTFSSFATNFVPETNPTNTNTNTIISEKNFSKKNRLEELINAKEN